VCTLPGFHLGAVVIANQVQHGMNQRPAPGVAHDLRADDDVAQLPRHSGRDRLAAVDRKGERVRLLVDAEMLALEVADLIAQLDEAGIRRAAVFSVAYGFGNPNRPAVEHEYDTVKAENDRVARDVARYPDRLRGFCGVNPLKDYALTEIARCARMPSMRYGLKLHFGNSDVMLDNQAHVAKLREVFRAANDARMAIVVHMRSSVTRQRAYGAAQVRKLRSHGSSNSVPSSLRKTGTSGE
jgi:predicted TIM-barrel fold metal-dependent hydrolase